MFVCTCGAIVPKLIDCNSSTFCNRSKNNKSAPNIQQTRLKDIKKVCEITTALFNSLIK